MRFPALSPRARLCAGTAALTLVAACGQQPLDFDLRGNVGAFSTAEAAQTATADRPAPDARGVITYPNYQVAVARRGDTVASVAARVGLPADELARFNGIEPGVPLREGEVIALPRKVAAAAPAPGSVDIQSLAGNAISSAPDTSPVQTTELKPAATAVPAPQAGPEPVRHKVARGETAYTIARLYSVPVKALGEWNGLGPDFAIREGQYLLIPVAGAAPPASTAAVTQPGAGSPTPTPPSAATPLPDQKIAATPPEPPKVSVGEPTRASGGGAMALPVQGTIIRAYAKGRNDGIDISAAPGTPVTAAAAGTVAAITADADKVPIIVIRHPDNLLTVYANVENITVKKGDSVSRGQQLASLRGGDNAYVHFEVRDGFDSVDPSPYLQ